MSRPAVLIELASDPAFARDLAAGGVFVPNCALEVMSECDVVVKAGAVELRLPARVVYVDPAKGTGLELIGFGSAVKEKLAALNAGVADAPAVPPVPAGLKLELDDDDDDDATEDDSATVDERNSAEDDTDADDSEARKIPRNVHERLRGMTLAEQLKMATHGEMHERIVLERMYGKTVWEALLRNPRLTASEVARIARMGQLPRPQLETITTNGTWLQIPEVRRALLSNPRLGTDQIIKVLRLMPRHELKMAPRQPSYPQAVRDAAKRMLLGS